MATMRREGGDNVPVSLKSRRTRERVLALTAALSFVGLLLGAPPFRFGETEMPGRNETSAGETFHRGAQQGPAPPLDDVWQGLTVGVCLCNRPIVSVGSCRHIPLIGYQPCPAGAQPTGGALSHRTLRLATGASLARSDTSLAGVTFTPAQPPFTVNSPRREDKSEAEETVPKTATACPFYVVRIRCSELQCHSAPIFFLLGLLLGRHS